MNESNKLVCLSLKILSSQFDYYTLAYYENMLDMKNIKCCKYAPGACTKTLKIRNFRKMDRFCSKLVSFLLTVTNTQAWTKHTSFLWIQYIVNMYYFYGTNPWCNKLGCYCHDENYF